MQPPHPRVPLRAWHLVRSADGIPHLPGLLLNLVSTSLVLAQCRLP